MFSRVAVAVLLLLLQCQESTQGGDSIVQSVPPAHGSNDQNGEPVAPILPMDAADEPSLGQDGQDASTDTDTVGADHDGGLDPTDTVEDTNQPNTDSDPDGGQDDSDVDLTLSPIDNTNDDQDGTDDTPTPGVVPDSGQDGGAPTDTGDVPHPAPDGTNGEDGVPVPPLSPSDTPAAGDPRPDESGTDHDDDSDPLPPHAPIPSIPAGPSDPSPSDPPVETVVAVPPLDFDMNAIAQISSFPFARTIASTDPFYKLITGQYANKADEDINKQKCYMGDPSESAAVELDTRMGTPLLKLEKDSGMKDLIAPGLSLASAFYRNQNATKHVQKSSFEGSCDNCGCKGGLRQLLIVAEPVFPTRLYCEACLSSSDQYPTEFYHLQGYSKLTAPKFGELKSVTFNQLYTSGGDLPVGSSSPLGAWADPQLSFVERLTVWNEMVTDHENEREKNFKTDYPLRPPVVDRYLSNGVPSSYNDLLTAFNADGAVRLLSSPLSTGNARPLHLTLACAQVQSAQTIATDSITHVEFIGTRRAAAGGMEESADKNKPEGYMFSDWEVYDRSRFEVAEAHSSSFNLNLFVSFSGYSCCSACCCSREQCGLKHATSEKTCKELNSTRSRTGHLVVRKADRKKPITVDGADAEALKQFNDLLSQSPFAQEGLPIFSQRFLHHKWKAMHEKLLDKTTGFGKLVEKDGRATPRFIEIINCVDEEKDCSDWAKCRGLELPNIEINPEDDPMVLSSKCNASTIQGLKVIKLEKDFNDVQLEAGDSVRIIAATLNGSQIHWTVGKNVMAMMNMSKTCDEQENIFVDSNKRDLIIRSVTPSIADSSISASTSSSAARLNVVVERKSYLKENMLWAIIVGGSVGGIFVGLLIFCAWWRCCRKRGSSRADVEGSTKITKASNAELKDGDQRNSGSEKGGTAKETPPALPSAVDDFFATPLEREKNESNEPIPIEPGQKDPFLVVTDQERTSVATQLGEGAKIPSATADPAAAAASPEGPAAAAPNQIPNLAAAAAAIPAVASKESQKDEEKSSSKSSSKSDGKGDEKDPKKKDKKDKKKDSKNKDGKKDKKRNDKKEAGKKKPTKKSPQKSIPKKKSPKKKVSANPKKSAKKSVAGKKK